jgi:hypothetical protein
MNGGVLWHPPILRTCESFEGFTMIAVDYGGAVGFKNRGPNLSRRTSRFFATSVRIQTRQVLLKGGCYAC